MNPWIYYWISTVALAGLLLYPAAKLIWILSVRRLERKFGRSLDEEERRGQLRRARFIAFLLSFAFAALFNYNILGMSEIG